MNIIIFITAVLLSIILFPSDLKAQELLINPSFENISTFTPAPVNGNNFYSSIPNWTVTPTNTANIVLPWSGYLNNADTTPSGGGTYYLDLNSLGVVGTVNQNVTLSTPGVYNISAWFSVRDTQQALTGCSIKIINSNNTVVATASVAFAATDPIGLWKQAIATNVALPAGNYTFQIVLPDPANVDLASFFRLPPISVTKTSTMYMDPVNGSNAPKSIPGGIVRYCILVANNSTYTASNITLSDTLPTNVTYVANTMASGTSCATATTNPAVNATLTGTTINVSITSLAGGASYAIIYNAMIN